VKPPLEVKKDDRREHVAACHFPVEVGERLSREHAGIAQPVVAVPDISGKTIADAIGPKEGA
jgi:hypothetical protein